MPRKGMRSMAKSCRVHVEIRGRGFNLLSDDNPDYLVEVANKVDARMSEVIEKNPQLTFEKAALLTALNYCDDLEKCRRLQKEQRDSGEDHVRAQLMEYAKELSRASDVIKNLEKELETAKKENDDKLEQIKREYELKEKEIMDMIDSM